MATEGCPGTTGTGDSGGAEGKARSAAAAGRPARDGGRHDGVRSGTRCTRTLTGPSGTVYTAAVPAGRLPVRRAGDRGGQLGVSEHDADR
ncbi:MAG TPA: hypothetical protein VF657_01140 [Actinoplanes sp.]|jgi:hypothetical protein